MDKTTQVAKQLVAILQEEFESDDNNNRAMNALSLARALYDCWWTEKVHASWEAHYTEEAAEREADAFMAE